MIDRYLDWDMDTDICKEIYFKELTHKVVGTVKSEIYWTDQQLGNSGRN